MKFLGEILSRSLLRRRSGVGRLISAPLISAGMAFTVVCWSGPQQVHAQEGGRQQQPAAEINEAHPLAPALKMAYESREALRGVQDYDATFSKRELINGKLKPQVCYVRIRKEPFSVYMKFVKPNEGREVIFVDGQNKNMLLGHETGILSMAGTVSLPIDGPDAMAENRYPITMLGIHSLLDQVIRQWEAEAKFGEVEVNFYRNAKLGKDVDVEVIESTHPKPRNQFRFHMTRLFIDKTTRLPLRVEQYAFPQAPGQTPPLVEEYSYVSLRTNLGLKNIDFSVDNPQYKFK